MNSIKDNQFFQEIHRTIFNILGSYPVEVYLFGSWAQGKVTPSSDVDIGILSKDPLPLGLLPRLREELNESHIPYEVEIVDLNRSDPNFRMAVITEGVQWTN